MCSSQRSFPKCFAIGSSTSIKTRSVPARNSNAELFEFGGWLLLFLEVRLLVIRFWECTGLAKLFRGLRLMSDRSNDEFFARGTAECWCCDEQEQQNSIVHLELMESMLQPYQR